MKSAPDVLWPIDRDDHEKIIYSYHHFALWRWRTDWPLPIGRKAVLRAQEEFGADYYGPGYVVLLNAVPFEGEEALWALRVHRDDNVLDLFGLARRTERGTFTGGGLVFVLRGEDTSLIDLATKAKQWWFRRRGMTIPGRPRYSGTWESNSAFIESLEAVLKARSVQGRRLTRFEVALDLHVDESTLKRWLKHVGIDWQTDVKKRFSAT